MLSLEVFDKHDTDARTKKNHFLVQHLSTCAVFLIEILMEEIVLVVAQNLKSEYRAKSKHIAFSGILGLSRIRCILQNTKFPNSLVPHKRKLFNGGFGRRNDTCSLQEILV